MNTILFLILFPLVPAIVLLVFPFTSLRNIVTRVSFACIAAASTYAAYTYFSSPAVFFSLPQHIISRGMFATEALLSAYIFVTGIRHRKYLASVLVTLQFAVTMYFEHAYASSAHVHNTLFIDRFSVIMALIIGIIGGLICVYALGYMKDFHAHHKEMKDKRPFFFFILFVFLSAMFGIVFSNSLIWLFFFWEITTLSSFLLIGYTKTPEAVTNAFRALIMNLSGGLAFALAILFLAHNGSPLELMALTSNMTGTILIPVALICYAGITKAAQLPFSSWLLGAMVAPTPTSALLHSSTMVKAGVYIVLRFAPVLAGTWVGSMVALTGGITFLLGAFMAVSQSNAKKVLAYSTVSNLGLIIACAGVGTHETVWAGIFLIIFHAISKSLLFLCVGTVEHRIGSRDIENMDNMIVTMPKLTMMIVIGICGMFIAPFGMLISKWAALKAFINVNSIMSPVLILILAYGSAVTVFFWTKWLGKITAINRSRGGEALLEKGTSADEWFSESVHAVLTVAACFLFPFISLFLVEPYVQSIFGKSFDMGRGNFIIMGIMVAMVMLIPAISYLFQTKKRFIFGTVYMGGRNETPDRQFDTSIIGKNQLTLKNYYMESVFGEKKIMLAGVIAGYIIIAVMFGVSIL